MSIAPSKTRWKACDFSRFRLYSFSFCARMQIGPIWCANTASGLTTNDHEGIENGC